MFISSAVELWSVFDENLFHTMQSPHSYTDTVSNYLQTLLDFGQSPNCLDRYGLTPLYYNILYDPDTKICHSLLYEHSKIGIIDKDGLQEIHQVIVINKYIFLKYFLFCFIDKFHTTFCLQNIIYNITGKCFKPSELISHIKR